MRSFAWLAIAGALGLAAFACAAPPIDDNLDPGDEVKLPDRTPTPTGDGGNTQNGDSSTTPPPPSNVNVTVNITGGGTGTVASTPAGITCTGNTCKGSFARGTKVTLQTQPGAGVVFTAWSGACVGASCVAIADADVTVNAELISLAGTWSGTYTNSRVNGGCNFNNSGNLSSTITAAGAAIAGTETITGLELRNLNGCGLVGTTTGSAPSEPVTIAGNTLTGTYTFNVNGAAGKLAFPYTATVTAAGITGKWTCATCTGGFTLKKP